MLFNLFLKSSSSLARHIIAIISEATVIWKPLRCGTPFLFPKPTSISRSARSFISNALIQTIRSGLIFNSLPWKIWLSIIAAIRLIEEVKACISPVKCKLISSLGSIEAKPPPVAPPLRPKTGPKEGSRRASITFSPILAKPSVKAMDMVVLPSPALVGVIALTKTSLPFFLSLRSSMISRLILALSFPYLSTYFSGIFAFLAISSIFSIILAPPYTKNNLFLSHNNQMIY